MIKLGEVVMILDLHRQGLSVSAIAGQLGIDRKTVRKYLARGLEAPVYGPRQPRPRHIDPFIPYLRARVEAWPGLTGRRLWRELKERGYQGGYTAVTDALRERLLPMLERHIAFYGQAPRQAAADGSFASRDNLRRAKAQGVRDMAFHKKGGLKIEDMVKSRWVYRKLRNFRAGIEADISCLKRAYGLARCTWRGLGHFRAYVWSAVVAYNLALVARLKPT